MKVPEYFLPLAKAHKGEIKRGSDPCRRKPGEVFTASKASQMRRRRTAVAAPPLSFRPRDTTPAPSAFPFFLIFTRKCAAVMLSVLSLKEHFHGYKSFLTSQVNAVAVKDVDNWVFQFL